MNYGTVGAAAAKEYVPDQRAAPQQHRQTPRGDILRKAAALTEGDRNAAYGDPVVNLGIQGELTTPFIRVLQNNPKFYTLPEPTRHALLGAMFQVLGKIARIAAGDPKHMDNYIDGAAYFAIAGEAVLHQSAMHIASLVQAQAQAEGQAQAVR